MYVCLCQGVTEQDIDSAIDAGATSLEQLKSRLKVGACCGACAPMVSLCLQQRNRADAEYLNAATAAG